MKEYREGEEEGMGKLGHWGQMDRSAECSDSDEEPDENPRSNCKGDIRLGK